MRTVSRSLRLLTKIGQKISVVQYSRMNNSWRKSVLQTQRVHLFPFRTQKLSSAVAKILYGRLYGKIAQRWHRDRERKTVPRSWKNGESETHLLKWGCSSAGRAPALQAGGHGFESHHLHHGVEGLRRGRLTPLWRRWIEEEPTGSALLATRAGLRSKTAGITHHLHQLLSLKRKVTKETSWKGRCQVWRTPH